MKRGLHGFFAVVAALSTAVVHAESWSAIFPGTSESSVAFPVGDGRHFVSIALPGSNPEQGKLQGDGAISSKAAKVFVDPVSRIVLFSIDGPAVMVVNLRSAAPLGAGFSLHGPSGSGASTLEWVRQIDGKVLPLSLIKVRYAGEVPRSGTPLLDGTGNLAAIAYTPAGGKDGYAVPVEVVKHVVDGVMNNGAVEKARLGLTLLPSNKSPQVTRVLDDSPASKSGIRVGDVLSEVGGRPVSDYAEAVNAFYFLSPDKTVQIKLAREGKEVAVSLTPAKGGK